MKYELNAMKAVYSYFFPEVRSVLRYTQLPDALFLVNSRAATVRKRMDELFSPPLEIPETRDGRIDLDELHLPVIKRVTKAYSAVVPQLGNFKYAYPTSGSSEGLFHLLAWLKTQGATAINVLKGEYEGYAAQAKNLGLTVFERTLEDTENCEPGYWFISNPSARDGNILPNKVINELCERGNKVILDLAYVGTTRSYPFNVKHKNIIAAVTSFSKPYGVFRFRIGGFVFARKEIPTLYGNKWFKDITRLLQALALAEQIGPRKLYEKYAPIQKAIADDINDKLDLGLKQSDVLLIANLSEDDAKKLSGAKRKLIEPFKRGTAYRFCLTPYFEKIENEGIP